VSTGLVSPFVQGGIVTIAASTTSAAASLPAPGDTLAVTNPTTALAWISLGGSGSAPSATPGSGYPVLPGARRLIGSGTLVTQVAAVLSSGSGSIYVEVGTGSTT
jgi:hypothetical protein